MLNSKPFLFGSMFGCCVIYLAALWLALQGHTTHGLVIAAAVLLIAHALEIPLALRKLQKLDPSLPRLVVLTLLFGLLWWVPARRGLFPVR